jgi:hypothetical protein
MKKQSVSEQIIIYQSNNKDVELDVTIDQETVWLTQAQMTKLFGATERLLLSI